MAGEISRRAFNAGAAAAALGGAAPAGAAPSRPYLMTVTGPLPVADAGFTLSHEHIVADLRPWAERRPAPIDRDAIVQSVLPHVLQARRLGCRTLIDCTASNLGRDPRILQAVAARSRVHIVTTTGLYAAADQQFLPDFARTASAEAFARTWIDEWRHGIDGSGVRPGLIKLGFNGGPLDPIETRLIEAAAATHRRTGLVIGAHVGPWRTPEPGANGLSALQQLDRLRAAGVDGSAYIWYHAQNEGRGELHARAVERGAWISYDGVAPETIDQHVELILRMRAMDRLGQVLVSHDAGWYTLATPDGGVFRPYDTVFTALIPRLRSKGLTDAEIRRLFVDNPARAYQVKVRLGT